MLFPPTVTAVVLTELKAPKQVRFADHQESDSLRVEWTRPSCTETGYIRNFLVIYCLDDECQGDTSQMAHLCVLYIVLKMAKLNRRLPLVSAKHSVKQQLHLFIYVDGFSVLCAKLSGITF